VEFECNKMHVSCIQFTEFVFTLIGCFVCLQDSINPLLVSLTQQYMCTNTVNGLYDLWAVQVAGSVMLYLVSICSLAFGSCWWLCCSIIGGCGVCDYNVSCCVGSHSDVVFSATWFWRR
jgi:hypothetical protein